MDIFELESENFPTDNIPIKQPKHKIDSHRTQKIENMGWHLEKTTEKLKTVNSERDALTMPKLPLPDAPMFLNIPSVPDSIQYQTQAINSSTKMKSPKSGTKYHQYDSPYNKNMVKQILIQATQLDESYLIGPSNIAQFQFYDKRDLPHFYQIHLQNQGIDHQSDSSLYNLLNKADSKLGYVVDTIKNLRGQDVQFSLGEIFEQTVQLGVIEIKNNIKKAKKNQINSRARSPNFLQAPSLEFTQNQNKNTLNMPLQQVVDKRVKQPLQQRTSSAQGHHNKIDFMQKFNTRPQDKDISVYETNFTSNKNPKTEENPFLTIQDSMPFQKAPDYNHDGNYYSTQVNRREKVLFEKQNYQNLNKTYENIPKTNNFMDESIVDDIVKQENDFKLLIKYVQLWKKFIKICRAQRKQKIKEMEKLMIAIARHEKNLHIKIWKCLQKYAVKSQILREAHDKASARVQKNLRIFYFKTMKKRYMRENRRKYLKKIAKSYYLEQRKYKCLMSWHSISSKVNLEASKLFEQMSSKNPYAAEILLEKMCHDFYMGQKRGQIDIQNIVKFHFYALKHFSQSENPNIAIGQIRIRDHLVDRFNSSVELILLAKQRRALKCWLNYTYIMKSFRVRHITNIKQKYFFDLQKICFDKKKIRYMRGRSIEILIRMTFQSLNFHAIKQSDLRRKYIQHFQIHRQKVTQRYLREWSTLYEYYSKFTKSQYGYTQVKASQIQFKKRYFMELKNYLLVRRVHKANIIKADNKFFHRYVRICFRNWAWYHLHFMKHQKFAFIDVNRRFKTQMKERYFRALQRAFQNEQNVNNFYRNNLRQKVFRSFESRKQFLILREQIQKICVFKYTQNSLRKSFNILREITKYNKQLSSLKQIVEVKYKTKLSRKVFQAFVRNHEKKKEKDISKQFLRKMSELKVVRNVFMQLGLYAKINKEMRYKHHAIQEQMKQKMLHNHFLAMMVRYNKKILDRKLGQTLKEKQEFALRVKLFIKWLRKFRHLKECDQLLTNRYKQQVYKDIFKLWRIKYLIQKEQNVKMHYYDEKQRIRYLKLYFNAFTDRMVYKIRQTHLKKLGGIFFLQRRIGTCVHVLRRYSKYRKIKRESLISFNAKLVRKVFYCIQRQWDFDRKWKGMLIDRSTTRHFEIFKFLHQYALKNASLRRKLLSFQKSREQKLKEISFKVLVCPEFYVSKEPRQLELHEYFKIQMVMKELRSYTSKRRANYISMQVIVKKRNRQAILSSLNEWRSQVVILQIEKQKALPLFEKSQQQILKGCFIALSDYKEKSIIKKQNIQTSQIFYTEALVYKSVESLRWYANRQIQRKSVLKFLLGKKKSDYAKNSFFALKNYTTDQKRLKLISSSITFKREKSNTFRLFESWKKSALKQVQEKELMAPTEQFTAFQYNQNLQKKIFKALYNNRTLKIIKRTMTLQSEQYFVSMIQRKALEGLAWYALVHKRRKQKLWIQGQIWQKSRIMNRWISAMNKVQRVKESIQGQTFQQQLFQTGENTLVHGATLDNQKSIKSHAVNQQNSQMKMPPRPYKSFDAPKPPNQVPQVPSLELKNLNNSSELRSAHDMMSIHLQKLIDEGKEGTEDVKIVKGLINDIKNKYQSSKAPQLQKHVFISDQVDDHIVDEKEEFEDPQKLEKAHAHYLFKLKVKSMFSIKQAGINKDHEVYIAHFVSSNLKQKALQSLKTYCKGNARLREAYNLLIDEGQYKLMRKSFDALKIYHEAKVYEMQNQAMAHQHYILRQYRLALFAFKKYQITQIMCKSMQIQVETAKRNRVFKDWLNIVQPRPALIRVSSNSSHHTKSHQSLENDQLDQINSSSNRIGTELLQDYNFDNIGFNDTAGTKFSNFEEMALQFDGVVNEDPTPFMGFEDDRQEQRFVDNSLEDSLEDMFEKYDQKQQQAQTQQQPFPQDQASTLKSIDEGQMKIVTQMVGLSETDKQQQNQFTESESDF